MQVFMFCGRKLSHTNILFRLVMGQDIRSYSIDT